MKQKLLPILILLIAALVFSACTRSLVPPPEQLPTQAAPPPLPGQPVDESGSSIAVPSPEGQPGTVDQAGQVAQPGTVDQAGQVAQPGTVDQAGQVAQPGTVDQSGQVAQPGTVDQSGQVVQPPVVGSEPIMCAYPPDYVPYATVDGDSLASLAAKVGVTAEDLAVVNCLPVDLVLMGSVLIYLPPVSAPVEGAAPPADASSSSGGSTSSSGDATSAEDGSSAAQDSSGSCKSPYTVRGGDWVYKIGRKCNISPYAIIQANGLAYPYWLRPGQIITLPKNAPPFP